MRPEAAEEIRGPLRPIETEVPGLRIGEVFPRLAGLLERPVRRRSDPGGRVFGASGEIVVTIYRGLGITFDAELPGPQGRPIRIIEHGVDPIGE
ncbi:MAG TPA: hypothetical protein VKP69_15770 [Isosphaeraceae bacterium]|nr:hypothetical protein [Isosphaeraceae bacterium]